MPDIQFTYDKPLSVGHLMYTTGVMHGDGTLSATTRTRSVVKLGGFHGAVQASVYDANDHLIAKGGLHTYGVDGVWIGQSDRTDPWTESFGADVGSRAVKVGICHSWNPQWLDGIQNTVMVIGAVLSAILGSIPAGGFMGVFKHSSMNDIAGEHNGYQSDPITDPLAVEDDGLDINAPLKSA